jgi:hypothetical protein
MAQTSSLLVKASSLQVLAQFEASASLERGALAPLWPKRRQVGALQRRAQFKLTHYLISLEMQASEILIHRLT